MMILGLVRSWRDISERDNQSIFLIEQRHRLCFLLSMSVFILSEPLPFCCLFFSESKKVLFLIHMQQVTFQESFALHSKKTIQSKIGLQFGLIFWSDLFLIMSRACFLFSSFSDVDFQI